MLYHCSIAPPTFSPVPTVSQCPPGIKATESRSRKMLQQRNTVIIKAWSVKLNCLILLVENHPDQIGGNRLLPFTQSIFSTT